jgi:hypothetical protein
MTKSCSFSRIHWTWQIAATAAIYSISAMHSHIRRPASRLLTLKPPARIYFIYGLGFVIGFCGFS